MGVSSVRVEGDHPLRNFNDSSVLPAEVVTVREMIVVRVEFLRTQLLAISLLEATSCIQKPTIEIVRHCAIGIRFNCAPELLFGTSEIPVVKLLKPRHPKMCFGKFGIESQCLIERVFYDGNILRHWRNKMNVRSRQSHISASKGRVLTDGLPIILRRFGALFKAGA